MSPEQCRAARAWLNWSQLDLAIKARVSSGTIKDFEAGKRLPHANNLAAIRRVLEEAGMEFLPSHVGVSSKKKTPPKRGKKKQ